MIDRRASAGFRIPREEDERGAIVRAERVDLAKRRGLCPRPAIAVGHAVRLVEQHDDLAAAPQRAGDGGGTREERPRECQDEQDERRAPKQEQRPVADLLPPHRAIRDPFEEHQRRKLDELVALAVNQVDQHRHRQRGEAEQQEGGKKGHQRILIIRSRAERNLNSP